MSVLKKIKEITEDMEALAKEKSVVTIISNSRMLVENYKSIKLFCDDKLVLDLDGTGILISGAGLVIDFFSPSRIIVCGTIKNISYMPDSVVETEEL